MIFLNETMVFFFQGDVVPVLKASIWHGKEVTHLFNVVDVFSLFVASIPVLGENSYQLGCALDLIFVLSGKPSQLILDSYF